jgi:hypothetical protein
MSIAAAPAVASAVIKGAKAVNSIKKTVPVVKKTIQGVSGGVKKAAGYAKAGHRMVQKQRVASSNASAFMRQKRRVTLDQRGNGRDRFLPSAFLRKTGG